MKGAQGSRVQGPTGAHPSSPEVEAGMHSSGTKGPATSIGSERGRREVTGKHCTH
jgi:hypothetical protein